MIVAGGYDDYCWIIKKKKGKKTTAAVTTPATRVVLHFEDGDAAVNHHPILIKPTYNKPWFFTTPAVLRLRADDDYHSKMTLFLLLRNCFP